MLEPEEMMKRQQVLAAFGEFAIRSEDLDEVLTEACRLVGEATGTGRAKVLEIQEGAQELLVRAGVGWDPDVVGKVRLQMSDRSSETYAIRAAEPVVSQDITTDDRFEAPQFMKQAGVVALVNVPIFVPGQRAYGVLQVDDTRPRAFGDDEIQFLRTYAMILGPVIDRLHLVEERTRDRDQLRASEARHRLLIENWAQAVWETDANGVVVADSPSWRAYTGQTLAEWLGYGWLDAIHPDDRDHAERQWRDAMVAHSLVDAEFRLRAPDGGWRWTNIRAAPVFDADGSIDRWAGMNVDIDFRKRAETAQREREEQQAFLLKFSDALRPLDDPVAVQTTAMELLVERLNVMRASCFELEMDQDSFRLTACCERQAASIPDRMRLSDFPPALRDAYTSERTVAVADTTIEGEFVSDPDAYARIGVRAWAAVPLVRHGRLVAWVGVHSATRRKWSAADLLVLEDAAERTWGAVERTRAEQALVRSETKYRILFSSIDEGFCIIEMFFDDQGNPVDYAFLETNPVFRTQAGFDIARGMRIREIAPQHEQYWFDIYGRIALSGEPARFQAEAASFGIIYDVYAFRVDDPELRRVAVVFRDVTEAKRAEAALRERERDLARVQRIGGVGGLDIDVGAGLTSRRSPEYLRLHGLTPETSDETHDDWRARVHPDDVEQAERALFSALDGDASSYDSEYRIIRASDGDVRWIAARADIERGSDGKAVRLIGAHVDVTEQKRAQHALRESQERLRQFGEASQDVLWIRNAATLEWTYLTPAFETIYGLDRQDALQGDNFRNWLDLILPEDRDHARNMIDRVIAGEPVTFEYRIRRPHDGEIRWLRDTDFPIRDESGRVTSIGGSGKDVTSVKVAEERLATSEERLRSAAEVAKFALWDWNIESGSIAWSDEHFRMLGYAVGEVSPSYEAWFARVHPDDRAMTDAAIAEARDTRTEYVHEFRALHPDGSVRWLSARARFFYRESGSPVRMVGAMLDTTDRREWEERQKILLAELQHRVRNILAVIRSVVSRSDDGERSTQAYVQHLQGRLSALARTQVLLTRRAGGGIDLEDMIRDELLAQATNPDQFSLSGPGVELSPKAAEVLTLAIHELATNATKYGAFAKLAGQLRVDWRKEDRDGEIWLVLRWSESGVAIVDAVPRRQGFGSELISRRIPYELKGYGSLSLKPGGLQSMIEFPLRPGDSILQTDGVQ